MKNNDWKKDLPVSIFGATIDTDFISGVTTDKPPFLVDGVSRVEIKTRSGQTRIVALSRVRAEQVK
jgi:hypothetical protein